MEREEHKPSDETLRNLSDLTTRMDERIKSIQIKEEELNKKNESINQKYIEMFQKIVNIEVNQSSLMENLLKINEIDKRLSKLEEINGAQNERWRNIANFLLQLIWVILAAYLLAKLNLQPPELP
jgi:hypothetical protein